MRAHKFFHNCIVFFTIFSFFFNTYAHASSSKQKKKSAEKKEVFDIYSLSIDKFFDFIENLEDELDLYTDEQIKEIIDFFIKYARLGALIDDTDLDVLENDIQELLEEVNQAQQNDYSYYFKNSNYYRENKPTIIKNHSFNQPEIVLCKNWFTKKSKKLGKVFKKHKKKIIVGTIAAIGVITGIAIVKKAKANKSKEKLSHEDKNSSDLSKSQNNHSFVKTIPKSAQEDLNTDVCKKPQETLEEIIKEKILSKKEQILQNNLLKSKKNSFNQKVKDFSSSIAHEVLDELSNAGSFFPKFAEELKDIADIVLPKQVVEMISLNQVKDFECDPTAKYEKTFNDGHKAIDNFFSTDFSEGYTREVKDSIKKINPMVIGYIPFSFSTLKKLANAGKIMGRGGLTKAGRALAKHGGRKGSIFPKPRGNPRQINKQGQKILEDIIHHPNKIIIENNLPKFGDIIDIKTPAGYGVRYYKDGKFIGFLEP